MEDATLSNEPLVSCVCVTENRAAFIPWLLWCYDRQRWQNRELVIVDSSPEPVEVADRRDIRVICTPPGLGVAAKRNIGLREARGEVITWFDDDDWQHPRKIPLLVEALGSHAPYGGSQSAYFVDLMNLRCEGYRTNTDRVIFNGAGFRRAAISTFRFPEDVRTASDSLWMNAIGEHYRNGLVILQRNILFFWLCHHDNLSNPAKKRRFANSLELLREQVGDADWGDTDEELGALRMRLIGERCPNNGKKSNRGNNVMFRREEGINESQAGKNNIGSSSSCDGDLPRVSLLIKATVLDGPFLDVMVRHMISQTACPFLEKAIIVEWKSNFTGKYERRSRSSEDELVRILEKLRSDGVVDRILNVDVEQALVKDIMERYFECDGHRVPTHAVTGGPIYSTLFGLESMTSDFVLQMDADIFFYHEGISWVKEALRHMTEDKSLWLMMTHPGPPIGPVGNSLGPVNSRVAMWDRERQIWRFTTATTRYFLCNRRSLRGRLRPLKVGGGCAPLEQCISDALKRAGAFRGALGDLRSWHLHAWHHNSPFPEWAADLSEALKRGYHPALQRGQYDLRLDREPDRSEWEKVLKRMKSDRSSIVQDHLKPSRWNNQHDNVAAQSQAVKLTMITKYPVETVLDSHHASLSVTDADQIISIKTAPIAIVIPVRNRNINLLNNAIQSLAWQSAGKPLQTLVVSHGSTATFDQQLAQVCQKMCVQMVVVGSEKEQWNKSFALNVGLQSVVRKAPFIMTMDADMILAENFLAVVLQRLESNPDRLILCRSSDLPPHLKIPQSSDELLSAFDSFRNKARLRDRCGTGGIQAARREFFIEIRGYDEDLVWWGAVDGDMVQRARVAGLSIEWVDPETAMLHQWHERKHKGLERTDEIEQAKRAWIRNHEIAYQRRNILKRNSNGWGVFCKLDDEVSI